MSLCPKSGPNLKWVHALWQDGSGARKGYVGSHWGILAARILAHRAKETFLPLPLVSPSRCNGSTQTSATILLSQVHFYPYRLIRPGDGVRIQVVPVPPMRIQNVPFFLGLLHPLHSPNSNPFTFPARLA